MSTKQITKKRGRINVVACNKCKRDKKKCDGSYLTQKPCRHCRDRKECCEYTEPSRLRVNKIQGNGDNEILVVSSDIGEVVINECEPQQTLHMQQELIDNESFKYLFFQLLTDPLTTNDQMNLLKHLYNEIMRNPDDPKFSGNKREELCAKLKLLSSSNHDDDLKIQIWDGLCSLASQLDKMTTTTCEVNNSTLLDPSLLNLNSWGSEPLGFPSEIHTTTDLLPSDSATSKKVESQSSNLMFSTDLDVINSTGLNDQQSVHETIRSVRNNRKVEITKDKKSNNTKQRNPRKVQRGNKRTQPYPAGGQIVIRPTKHAHTIIWHQNDPLEDVPFMAHSQPTSTHTPPPQSTPPTTTPRPPQRTRFQPPQTFAHYQPMVPSIPPIPINLWDHSTTMTMLSPELNSKSNHEEIVPITNSILLSPTPSLRDDMGDVASSPSNSSVDHTRTISDDETGFSTSCLTHSTGSPQSPSLYTMDTMEAMEYIDMLSSSSTITDEYLW